MRNRLPSSTASSNLISSDTSTGLFPPSSSVTLFKFLFVAATWIFLQTATLPVKLILRVFTCEPSATPASAAPPRMLRTPGGTPASMASEPMSRAESGFISLALEIRTLPAARAGAAFMVKVRRAVEGVDGGADAEGLVADDLGELGEQFGGDEGRKAGRGEGRKRKGDRYPEKALAVGEAFS